MSKLSKKVLENDRATSDEFQLAMEVERLERKVLALAKKPEVVEEQIPHFKHYSSYLIAKQAEETKGMKKEVVVGAEALDHAMQQEQYKIRDLLSKLQEVLTGTGRNHPMWKQTYAACWAVKTEHYLPDSEGGTRRVHEFAAATADAAVKALEEGTPEILIKVFCRACGCSLSRHTVSEGQIRYCVDCDCAGYVPPSTPEEKK